MSQQKPIVFFDGVCHLCNKFVDALLQRDQQQKFLFAPLQGETAKTLLSAKEREDLQSVILLEGQKKYKGAEAVLRILILLGGTSRLFGLGYLVPPYFRNQFYHWVARHRYSWFGTQDQCRLPTAEEKNRLLP
jgi:predicted DCC family thiol-disulfide oxidoreductase YuxK